MRRSSLLLIVQCAALAAPLSGDTLVTVQGTEVTGHIERRGEFYLITFKDKVRANGRRVHWSIPARRVISFRQTYETYPYYPSRLFHQDSFLDDKASTLYVASRRFHFFFGGGLFRFSRNRWIGLNNAPFVDWTIENRSGVSRPFLYTGPSAFALAYVGKKRVLYAAAALGVAPENQHAGKAHPVYRSRDDGRTWDAIAVPGEGEVTALCKTPEGLLVSRKGGTVYFSSDQQAWAALDSLKQCDISRFVAVDQGRTVWALLSKVQGPLRTSGLSLSVDAGRSWQSVDVGRAIGLSEPFQLTSFAASDTAAAIALTPTGSKRRPPIAVMKRGGIYQSRDRGATWIRVPFPYRWTRNADRYYNEIPRAPSFIALHPKKPNTLFAYGGLIEKIDKKSQRMLAGLARTVDGGATWKLCGRGLFDRHGLFVHRTSGSGGGVGPTGIQQMLFSRRRSSEIYIVTRVDGVYRSRNGGTSWKEIGPFTYPEPIK